MRTIVLAVIALVVVFVVLFTLKVTSHSEQIEHHGQLVQIKGELDDCIVCHDGTAASHTPFCTVKCNFKSPHSVLKEYPPRGKEGEYAPISSLPEKGIRLFDGKITCVSCHDLANPDKNHLVVSNKGSNLCFGCHIK